MITTSAKRRARLAPLIAVIAAGLLGATAFATPASAVETGPNIDPAQTGSIVLHKLVQPDGATGLPNDGSELSPAQLAGLTPLEGVVFSLQLVGSIDLETNEGWAEVQGLTAADVLADASSYPLTASGSGPTDAAGLLAFPALELGVYLVTETAPGNNQIAQIAAPFLVTMPIPTGNNTWLYDVNVYPKNAVTEVTKTVDDAAAFGLGDTVDWTITGSVPYLAAADPLNAFAIRDTLDSRLGFSAATVTAITAAGDALALVAADYVLTTPAAGTPGAIDAVFTAAGLAKLQAEQGAVVTLQLATTVLSIGDGVIDNSASLAVNDSVNTADAETNWGALEIFKYATVDGVQEGLAGARFQIFTSAADAGALANPVSVDGEDTFTSSSTANIAIEGLKAGDYWVVEIIAPVGYVANTTPIEVTVVVGTIADAVVLDVENSQVPAWMLPLTGGGGTALFGLGGGLLVLLAGAAALVVNNRRATVVTA